MKIGSTSDNILLLLVLCGLSTLSSSVFSQTVTTTKTSVLPFGISPSVSYFYERSAADEKSAYYSENTGINLGLSTAFGSAGSFSLSTGISRDLDALEMRNIWSSTTLGFAAPSMKVFDFYDLAVGVQALLPTNSDMRTYLSYRGSLGANISFGRSFELQLGHVLDQINLGLNSSAVRSFFEYDATQAGTSNRTVNLKESAELSFRLFQLVSASAGYTWSKSLRTNGSWTDPIYALDLGLSSKLGEHLTLSLAQTNQDQALSYDYQTAKIALYNEQATAYTASTTYAF